MMIRRAFCSVTVVLLVIVGASSASAQTPAPHQQVISANPFGLLLEFFNAEYERVVGTSSTAGLGGSFLSEDGDDYMNADVFWRFYPSANPLDGWAFGVKLGVTSVSDNFAEDGTFVGYGFDVNRSWLLGANDNFYAGVGFGLKRLLGDTDGVGLEFIPTIRIVNIGVAF